jgi:hypothetical protein
MAETKFPTEIVDLPSKGTKLYPETSALRSGQVEMRYMTARDEDILTNQNYIERGVVVDKLLQSLIVDKNVNYSELLVGDKNALLVAARILGYGAEYTFDYRGQKETVNLTELPEKELDPVVKAATENCFEFICPVRKNVIKFKLLTHADDQAIEQELKGLRKLHKDGIPEMSTRLKYMILSVDGETDRKAIRDFVDNRFMAVDSRAFRKYVAKIQPDIELKFYPENGPEEGVDLPIGITFLWPDAGV